MRPFAVPGGPWLVQFQPGGFLIFDNIILLCRRLCAMLFMYSLINSTVIVNCVNCLCNSIQLYYLWRFINCACLLPFWWWISPSLYCCCMSKDNNAFICVLSGFMWFSIGLYAYVSIYAHIATMRTHMAIIYSAPRLAVRVSVAVARVYV